MKKNNIVPDNFREDLAARFVELLDVRGRATELAKIISRSHSYVNGVKRGNPVNALHLKAVGELLGGEEVLRLLDVELPRSASAHDSNGRNATYKLAALHTIIAEIERKRPEALDKIEAYLLGIADIVDINTEPNGK